MKGREDMKKIDFKKGLYKNIFLTVLVFGLTAFFFAPPSYSILRETGDSDSTIATADWIVTLEQAGVNNNVTVVPENATGTYILNIKSLSKVDVTYDIVLSNLPAGVDASIDGVNFPTVTSGTVTFSNAGTILVSSQNKTNSHTLTFRGTDGSLYENNPINQVVNIDVYAKQTLN